MTKSELRKIYLARRKNLSISERREKSAQIARRFFASFNLTEVKFLHCFLPIEKFNEIDTRIIFEKIWRGFPAIETLAPRVDFQTKQIESLKFSFDTKLVENSWQINEPVRGEIVETKKIDLVLIPLVAFDYSGFRVGYGRGFYDKFLKNCRANCVKIGLSYFAPVEKISDAQSFDVKLDFCVTPTKVIKAELNSFRQPDAAENSNQTERET